MHSQKNDQQDNKHSSGFAGFVSKRIVVSVLVIIGVIWVLNVVLDRLNLGQRTYGIQSKVDQGETQDFERSDQHPKHRDASGSREQSQSHDPASKAIEHAANDQQTIESSATADRAEPSFERSPDLAPHPADPSEMADSGHVSKEPTIATGMHASKTQHDAPHQDISVSAKTAPKSHGDAQDSKHPPKATDKKQTEDRDDHVASDQDKHVSTPRKTAEPHEPSKEPPHAVQPTGVAFVTAVMKPIDYELNHRFWGWRPNDIVNITDNINNSQLGTLEVTRRTVVQLAQRISRTGSTDSFNPHLENAMNWVMVKADRYWFPAPESKYKESLEELAAYKKMLLNGKASFYIRTDNLIPLLTAYEDLLGSCDENLVKSKEDDGSAVSFFKADDYFYYAKGVASAMAIILEAVHHDFSPTLESRNGSELLHHAIASCEAASKLSPLIIMDSNLDGFFANHRANIAAPISHARFYISQLIKTLST